MKLTSLFIFVISFVVAGFCDSGNPCDNYVPPQNNAAGKSTFCVVVGLDDGRLVIITELSRFHPSAAIRTVTESDKAAYEKAWSTQVSDILATLPRLYEFGMTDSEKELENQGKLPPEATARVSNLTDQWTAAAQVLNAWSRCPDHHAGEHCGRLNGGLMLHNAIGSISGNRLINNTPLYEPAAVPQKGIAVFLVDDPVNDFSKPGVVQVLFDAGGDAPKTNGRIFTQNWVIAWLQRTRRDKFWISSEISQALTDIFSGLGLQPTVTASQAGRDHRLTIEESPLIGRIQLPGGLDPATKPDFTEICKILYLLLPKEDLNLFLQKGQAALDSPAPGGTSGFILDLSKLRSAIPDIQRLQYLDLLEIMDEQAQLQAIGYGLNAQAEAREKPDVAPPWDLMVTKLAKGPEADRNPTSAPDANRSQTQAPASVAPITTPQRSTPALQPRPVDPALPDSPSPIIKAPSITYGAGIQYRSGQGVRPLASIGTQSLLGPWGNATLQGTVGGDTTHPIGGGQIHDDFLAFGTLKNRHRLTFDLTGGQDATSKRLLGTSAETDQQEIGGGAKLSLDLLQHAGGFSSAVFADAEHNSFSFSRTGTSIPHFNLQTLDLGTSGFWVSEISRHPTRIQSTLTARLGFDLSATGAPYQKYSLELLAHQRLSDLRLFSLDFAGHFADASQKTPIFELPMLGGADSLRGFRQDDVLARRVWSLQTELWAPVPGTLSALPGSGGFEAFRRFLRDNIRLAGFLDIADARQTELAHAATVFIGSQPATNVLPGTRTGPGLGLRFVRGNLALKFDWAYGFGTGQSGNGRGRFYLGVVQNGAF